MSRALQIRNALGSIHALILTDPISIRYASGFHITDGAALITRDDAFLITDSRYIEAAEKQVRDMRVLLSSVDKPVKSLLRSLADELPPDARIGAEDDRLSRRAWDELETLLGRRLVPAGDILARLRASKDEAEVELLCAAQRTAEQALDSLRGVIRPGMTEKQVAAELVYRLYKFGGEANSFDPIVVTGAKSSMPHGVPGDDVIRPGDFLTMDFGTMVGGYCSDMTRTVAIGSTTAEMREVYSIVLEAQLAGIDAARPGVTGRQIDGAARAVIERAGYGAYFGHSFGHSLGLEIHEAPNASSVNNEPMPEGAFISAEPGIYLPGRFGVRIEDTMWLHGNGARVITKAPKELIVL